jgi:hypothetical protein
MSALDEYFKQPEVIKEIEDKCYALVNSMIDGANDGLRFALRKRLFGSKSE